MRILRWMFRITLFVILFGLALQNTAITTLRFYAGLSWDLPLIVWLLLAFVAGALMGLLVALLRASRLRREVLRLRREAHEQQREAAAQPTRPEIVDAI